MRPNSDNTPNEEAGEESGDTSFDFWSDEGARLFNEILDEGSAYLSTGARLSRDPEGDPDDEQCEDFDPDLI
jgi:phosphosulfolactate synthase (CoM biosynthesis protein A)